MKLSLEKLNTMKKGFYCDLCDKSMHKFIDIKANKFIYSDKFCKSLLTEFKDYITWKNSKLI